MKTYKVRLNCNGFRDVVVLAISKAQAKAEARDVANSNEHGEWEFGEFLELERGDQPENNHAV